MAITQEEIKKKAEDSQALRASLESQLAKRTATCVAHISEAEQLSQKQEELVQSITHLFIKLQTAQEALTQPEAESAAMANNLTAQTEELAAMHQQLAICQSEMEGCQDADRRNIIQLAAASLSLSEASHQAAAVAPDSSSSCGAELSSHQSPDLVVGIQPSTEDVSEEEIVGEQDQQEDSSSSSLVDQLLPADPVADPFVLLLSECEDSEDSETELQPEDGMQSTSSLESVESIHIDPIILLSPCSSPITQEEDDDPIILLSPCSSPITQEEDDNAIVTVNKRRNI